MGRNIMQKHGEREVLQNNQHDKGEEVRKKTIYFIFRLNIVIRDSYQADEIVMEIKEWKQKVPDDYVKSFNRVLLDVLETLIVS